MAKNDDFDFLDDFNPDEVKDPTVNDQPIYRREMPGFFCGEASIAVEASALKVVFPGTDKEFRLIELYFEVPDDARDSDGNNAIKIAFNLPKAAKPAGMALVKLGVGTADIKAALSKPTAENFEKYVKPALTKLGTAYLLQVPGMIKGKGGKRYPKQEIYSANGWEALKAQFNGVAPTAGNFDIPATADAGAAGGDDPYDV